MQRPAGKPAAEHGVDRGGKPHHTLLANEAGREARWPKTRINSSQYLAEMSQYGLWLAHGNPL
jgi:hypothetical protein